MKKFFLLSLIILVLDLITGCKKEFYLDNNSSSGGNISPVEYTTASVSGRVVDMNGQPLNNVTISTVGGSLATTDINGQFNLTDTKLDKNAAYLSASKTGYFTGSKTFLISDNSKNYIEFFLIPKTVSGTFGSSSGGKITVANGGSVNFQANAVQDATTGVTYSGTVTVAAYYINPANSNVTQIMPGELRGIDSSNKNEEGLQSFSMMVIELTGSAGQKLQLISGKPATITFPIPSSLQSSAPAIIPLWYFNDAKGLWKGQGTATKQGNNYTGNATHFSYWNCDAGIPIVKFNLTVKDSSGNALSGTRVDFKLSSDSGYNRYYTNATGNVEGKIPANQQLQLEVFNRCGNLLYTQTVNTGGSDIDLGVIKINSSLIPVIFSGTVKNCSGNSIAGGLITVLLDGVYTTGSFTNGTFSLTVNRCTPIASVANVVAIDTAKNLQYATSIQNVTNTNITNIPMVPCTQSADQYVTYTINNNTYSFTYPTDSLSYNPSSKNFSIWAMRRSGANEYLYMLVNDTIPGITYSKGFSINQSNIFYQNRTTDTVKTTITELGAVKTGYITGSFNGNLYTDTTSADATRYPVTGTFRIKRN